VGIEEKLRTALNQAMRDRADVASALRSALGAIANAQAVEDPQTAPAPSAHVAGAVAGLGAAEVERAALGEQDRRALVAAEAQELAALAARLREHGRFAQAESAERGAAVLLDLLAVG